MTLREWIKQFAEQFEGRELDFMSVHKASIAAQLKDSETGEIHLHSLQFKEKNAPDLSLVVKTKPPFEIRR